MLPLILVIIGVVVFSLLVWIAMDTGSFDANPRNREWSRLMIGSQKRSKGKLE
jgi:hypothetical protein